MTLLALLACLVAAPLLWPGRRHPPDPGPGPGVGVPAARVLRRSRVLRGRVPSTRADDEVAAVADLLAACLRAGLAPPDALGAAEAAAAGDGRVADAVREARRAAAAGRDVGPAWERHLAEVPQLGLVCAAWRLSDHLGVPLAPAVEVAARAGRARTAAGEDLDAQLAGARASMAVLTLLPLVGPLAVVLVGLDPRGVYLSSPVGLVAAVGGVVLTGAGWVTARWIVRRAGRPARLRR